ncbi:MAG TPA: hypothetical protein VG387_07350 [Rhizomicrobium sp.]|jgi:hypothetical protein|nr:hypothetical protein [Rhizomicrobium sp.]
MVSRIAGTLALLLALGLGGATVVDGAPSQQPLWRSAPPSPPPQTTGLPQQIAATIAALQGLGAGGTTAGIAYVENYAHPNDGGGGIFVWLPTATTAPDNCITFAASGAATGLWQRQLNGTPFTVDMCGTGNADDGPAFNAAFQVCLNDQLVLTLPAKTYTIQEGLTVPSQCAFYGAGRLGFYGALATVLDFRKAPASVTTLMSIVGNQTFGKYGVGTGFGGFEILDSYALPRTAGLYVSRIANVHAADIGVYSVLGTGIFLGQQQQSTYRNLYVYTSGSPTQAEIDIDGENSNGVDYVSTTTSLYDVYAEVAGRQGTNCGIAINRNLMLTITGGDSEANGNLVCVGNKPAKNGVGAVTIQSFDMETPAAGSDCVNVGSAWSGAPGRGVVMMRLVGDACIPNTASGSTAFRIANTTGFYAEGNYVNSFAGQTYFDFEGTNINPQVAVNGSDGAATTYVMVNGSAVSNALVNQAWSAGGTTAAH